MFRAVRAVRVTPAFTYWFSGNKSVYDHNNLEPIGDRSQDAPETGFDRVKKLFEKNKLDDVSVELRNVIQSSCWGAFFGACMGGTVRSREAYLYFIENNQASIFKTTLDAKKKLQDYVTVAFAKGATFWAWRLGLFTGTFMFISTVVSAYRGETSLVEFVAGGLVTGGMYRAHMGLAATCVGAGLGAALGTIGGLGILLLLKISGFSMADIQRALTKINESRQSQMHQAEEKASTIKNDQLTRHHDMIVAAKGEKKLADV